MNTFIIFNPNKPEINNSLEVINKLLSEISTVKGQAPPSLIPDLDLSDIDYLVVLGGDGTILRTVKSLKMNQIPIVSVNFGKLGFLTTFQYENFAKFIPVPESFAEAFFKGSISYRVILEGYINGITFYALNDFVINAGDPFRSIYLNLSIDNKDLTTIAGDGLILSTATGSTAYNLSANGPLLLPEARGIIINALNPHALTYRPLVVHQSATIMVKAMKVNTGTALVVDGEKEINLMDGDTLRVSVAPFEAKLVLHPKKAMWSNLIEKLRWGTH